MIYFCIPAYNEEKTIGVLLWKLRQVMASFPRDYQLLVVDDASTDKTSEALRPYQRVLPLTVIRNEQRRGYATALEMLFREAARRSEYPKRDAIVTLQADFTEDPEQVVTLLKRIEAGDDIVATTPVFPEDTPWQVRWSRKLALRAIRRRGWPEDVDPLSGLRAYRVQVVRKAIEAAGANRLLTWSGWLANAELLAAVQPHSRRTEAVESAYRPERHRRPSRMHPWQLVWQAIGFGRGRQSPERLEPLDTPPPQIPEKRGREELQAYVESRGFTRERPARVGNGRGRERPERGRDERGRGQDRGRGGRSPRGAGDGRQPAAAAESRRQPPADRKQRPAGESRRQPGGAGESRRASAGRPADAAGERRQDRGEGRQRRDPNRPRRPRNGARRPEEGEAAAQEVLAALTEAGLAEAGPTEVAAVEAGLNSAPEAVGGDSAGEQAETGVETPKRRRRRRGRGRGRRVTQGAESETTAAERHTSVEQLELVVAGEGDEQAGTGAAEGEGNPQESTPRTGRRRRRGGRRGRGRARATMDSTQDGGAEPAAEPAPGNTGPAEGIPNEVNE